jgi:hypothetical protein
MENIFGSKFKLYFKQKQIEEEYTKDVNEKLNNYVKLLTISLGMLSLIPCFEVAFMFYLTSYKDFMGVTILTFTINLIYLVLTCLVCNTKNIKILRVINYINYSLVAFILLNILYPLVHYMKISKIILYGIISLEVFARMVWILLGLHGFMEGLLICIFTSVAAWSTYATIGEGLAVENNILLLITRTICMMFVVIFAYFLEKTQRKVYYFDYLNKKKNEWNENVLNKMNAGFFSYKNKNINYINHYLQNEIKNWKFLNLKPICSNSKTTEHEEGKFI